MCGIFGTVNHKVIDECGQIFKELMHRGPDEQNCRELDNVELYHTRLAIQDRSPAGSQPMSYNGLHIVFNGEIYNHMELRKQYGIAAASASDTLTILMLYEKIGLRMLNEFDGMFAMALYDSWMDKLYLMRDRAGKKPLYYYLKGEKLVFSSELNTLKKILPLRINAAAIADYLYLGYNYRKTTPYMDVCELENGHLMLVNTLNGHCEIKRWFNITEYYLNRQSMPAADVATQLDLRLQLAVKRRIDSSDLEVGAFLSGGIDSGLVTAIAAGHTKKLSTFTVRVDGAYDESHLAQQVAERYATNHTVVDISFKDLKYDIETILANYGEPYCDSSAIPSYYVAREAKKHITVVLNGDGADELFGGYRRYVPFKYYDFFSQGAFTKTAARALGRLLPVANEKKSIYNYLFRLVKLAGYPDPVQTYCSSTSDLMVGWEHQFLQQPGLTDIRRDLEVVRHLPISSLNKLLLMDFQSLLTGDLLPKMDIATMAHSLEGRSPFLSKELIEFSPGISDKYKISNTSTKFILRRLARKYLPEQLINQPKRGFEIPLKAWVNSNLKDVIHEYLLSPAAFYQGFIHKSFIEDLLVHKVKISEERRAKILFCVFGLEVWYRNL